MLQRDSQKAPGLIYKGKREQAEQWLEIELQDWKSRNKYVEGGLATMTAYLQPDINIVSQTEALDSLMELLFGYARRSLNALVSWFSHWGYSTDIDAIAGLDSYKRVLLSEIRVCCQRESKHLDKNATNEKLNKLATRIESELIEKEYRPKLLAEWRRVKLQLGQNPRDDEFIIKAENGVLRRGRDGFRSFSYAGRTFTLNKTEARITEKLWEAAKDGTVWVNKNLFNVGSYENVSKVFRKNGRDFYNTFIEADGKGNYRLKTVKI